LLHCQTKLFNKKIRYAWTTIFFRDFRCFLKLHPAVVTRCYCRCVHFKAFILYLARSCRVGEYIQCHIENKISTYLQLKVLRYSTHSVILPLILSIIFNIQYPQFVDKIFVNLDLAKSIF